MVAPAERAVLTVSQLNRTAKDLLESLDWEQELG